MASKKKFPKTPKAGASLKQWENYKKRCEDVKKHNAGVDADKKKKEAVKASVGKIKSGRK